MKRIRNRFDARDANGRRKIAIQSAQQCLETMLPIRIEMKYLPARMHAGVGSTTPVNTNKMLKNHKQPCLNHILHRIMIDLTLPSVKLGSVVGNGTFPPHRFIPANPTVSVNQPVDILKKYRLIPKEKPSMMNLQIFTKLPK